MNCNICGTRLRDNIQYVCARCPRRYCVNCYIPVIQERRCNCNASYCSVECQSEAWSDHQHLCPKRILQTVHELIDEVSMIHSHMMYNDREKKYTYILYEGYPECTTVTVNEGPHNKLEIHKVVIVNSQIYVMTNEVIFFV